MSRVTIVKGEEPVEATIRALEAIWSEVESALSGKPILIKPNYINSKHPSTGITTDSRVMEGIVKFLKQHDINEIIIGEGSGYADTFQAFKVAGVDTIAKRWNVRLLDLNKDEFVEVTVPNPLSLRKVRVAKTALNSAIISVPKLKLHRLAGVSLSLKNMMGALASKGSMHTGSLSKNIVDLASILRPSVSVVDGIVAGEGHETSANPVQMNLVIAGIDPVAVDTVSTTVMGIPPNEVKHLILAEKKGLGTCRMENITVLGQPVEEVSRKFSRSLSSRILVRVG
jgi:uncharacterized protein (DUF362 family)